MNEHAGHNWWECEECRRAVSDRMDARLRADLIKQGISEHNADLLIKQARDEGEKLRAARHPAPPATPHRPVGSPGG